MNYWYDGQFKNVLSQFLRIFSEIKYKTGVNRTGGRELLPVHCQVGSQSRLIGAIQRKNSENVALYAPMISAWIQNVNVARNRTQNPVGISRIQVNEKKFDYENGHYVNEEGSKYTLERLQPVPYDITMQVDIWTTNEDMKLQILEQILLIFNPALAMQKNQNPLDWTNHLDVELTDINYSSRNVPVGDDIAMEVTTLTFKIDHFYLNPPAKLLKQETIQNIFTNVGFDQPANEIIVWKADEYFQTTQTYKNLSLEVIGDELKISSFDGDVTWLDLFSALEQEFEPNMFHVRLMPNYKNVTFTTDDVLIRIDSISKTDPTLAIGTVNKNTLPSTSVAPIDGVLNPRQLYPNGGLDYVAGTRYFISEDIIPNTVAWGSLEAKAGSIIQCSEDGVNWLVSYDSTSDKTGWVVRNKEDGELYVNVDTNLLISVYQGTYRPASWRMVTVINNNISN